MPKICFRHCLFNFRINLVNLIVCGFQKNYAFCQIYSFLTVWLLCWMFLKLKRNIFVYTSWIFHLKESSDVILRNPFLILIWDRTGRWGSSDHSQVTMETMGEPEGWWSAYISLTHIYICRSTGWIPHNRLIYHPWMPQHIYGKTDNYMMWSMWAVYGKA